MLEVPRPHICTNAGTFPKVQVHFILSLPSSMSKLIRKVARWSCYSHLCEYLQLEVNDALASDVGVSVCVSVCS